jgi:dienelactone hydrolase/predicted Ser/Thr protein kinase
MKGKTFAGKYSVEGEIGQGGMGIVYKAEDTKLKRTVALKLLPPELERIPEARERFIREAQSSAALSHPSICTIHEVEEAEGQPYIAMEFVSGESLRQKVARGPLSTDEAVNIAVQVAGALEAAHQKGIIHRDIKSANIMVTEDGRAKVMDFGLAKMLGAEQLTREPVTIGTVACMSPEQARGEDLDRRTDLWSFGVVLYEMLTGQMPFRGDRESIILYSIATAEPKPVRELKPDIPAELQRIIDRALKKTREDRYASASEMTADLRAFKKALMVEEIGGFSFKKFLRLLRRPRTVIPAALALVLLSLFAFWFISRQAKIKWAREKALPEIKALSFSDEFFWGWNQKASIDIFRIGKRAGRYISNEPEFKKFWPGCYSRVSFETDPPESKIFAKPYASTYGEWRFLGVSPLENVEMPLAYYRWRVKKEGFEPEEFVAATLQTDVQVDGGRPYPVKKDMRIFRTLDKIGTIPPGMVHVRTQNLTIGSKNVKLGDYYMDKYEVTNSEFKEFVLNGGYKTRDFWKHEFSKQGNRLMWEEAMAEFVDGTGLPGPATWWGGDYPEGKGDYPVTGISWYEAAAYAECFGKSLPTIHYWDGAQRLQEQWENDAYLGVLLVSESNFSGKTLLPAANDAPMSASGVCQMAGNVREWCWNEAASGRCVRGGAWDDPTYMFGSISQADPFDRSEKNGVRCMKRIDLQEVPVELFGPFAEVREFRDYQTEKPVSDEVFRVYRDQFDYDKKPLDAVVEERDESNENWIKERIVFNAAYTDDNIIYSSNRMLAYLFLPKNTPPPYQVVVYFPAGGGPNPHTSRGIEKEQFNRFDFIVKNGRAFMYPVYLDYYERQFKAPPSLKDNSRELSQFLVHLAQDCRRSIDYLETRKDIDISKLAFFGWSWGVRLGRLILAVEDRFKAGVLLAGGLERFGASRPEVDAINFVPRIEVPVLMLNGKYDMIFPYEVSVKPMFDLLGTPQKDKLLKLYDTDHGIPTAEVIKETQAFLNNYLGPVK